MRESRCHRSHCMRLDSIMNASIRNLALLKVAADGPDASSASSSRQAVQRTHLTNKTSSAKFNKNPGIRWVHWCAPWTKNSPGPCQFPLLHSGECEGSVWVPFIRSDEMRLQGFGNPPSQGKLFLAALTTYHSKKIYCRKSDMILGFLALDLSFPSL